MSAEARHSESAAQEWMRIRLAEAPPLTEEQRDELRALLDLTDGSGHD